jgi:hypothetical protein
VSRAILILESRMNLQHRTDPIEWLLVQKQFCYIDSLLPP